MAGLCASLLLQNEALPSEIIVTAMRIIVFFFCFLPALAVATNLTFGDFSIQWPAGYEHLAGKAGNQFENSEGVGVTVDVLGHGPMDKGIVQDQINKWSSYAHGEFVALATRHGEIVFPLTQEQMPSGSLLYWIGVDGHQGSTEHFGILFLDISPQGRIAQVVVEGPGLAKDHVKEFRSVMETEQWNEE